MKKQEAKLTEVSDRVENSVNEIGKEMGVTPSEAAKPKEATATPKAPVERP